MDFSSNLVVLLGLVIILAVVVFLELKFLKKRRHSIKNLGLSKKEDSLLPDRAHNALITARAISSALSRDGTDLGLADELLEKAKVALEKGDYRVCIDYTERAKESMKKAKARRAGTLEIKEVEEAEEGTHPEESFVTAEMTTKEFLLKKVPKNYLQSRFCLSQAQEAIEEAEADGGNVSEVRELYEKANLYFEQKDYDRALTLAIQCRKAILGGQDVIEVEYAISESERKCPSCGAVADELDVFCRKCGSKLETLLICENCGKKALEGDVFCRACGEKLKK